MKEKGAPGPKEKTPLGWGRRFREYVTDKETTLADVAERIGRAESTIRSWTNGTRDINLKEFFELCDAAGLDPASVLFAGKVDAKFLEIGDAWSKADEMERGAFLTVARGVRAKYDVQQRSPPSAAPPPGVTGRTGPRSRP